MTPDPVDVLRKAIARADNYPDQIGSPDKAWACIKPLLSERCCEEERAWAETYIQDAAEDAVALDLNVRALLDRLVTAEAVVSQLPKTADGVPIAPGMTLWCVRTARTVWTGTPGTATYRCVDAYTDHDDPQQVMVVYLGRLGGPLQRFGVLRPGMSITDMSMPEYCYSTLEAARNRKSTVETQPQTDPQIDGQ